MGNGESAGSNKRTFLCECLKSVFVAGDTVRLEFIWPGPAPRGGQFFLIKPQRTSVFLGRPISVADWKQRVPPVQYEEKERRVHVDRRLISNRHMNPGARRAINSRVFTDRRQTPGIVLGFYVIRRGSGSRDIVDIRPGEEAVLIGPLGNYWAQTDILSGNSRGPIALVGGGVGIAPLLASIPELENRAFDLYAGFRTGSFGLKNIKPRSLIISTEDGSLGLKGRITDFFTPSGYGMVFACGPEPMLKVVGDTA